MGGGGEATYTNQWSIGSYYDLTYGNNLVFHFLRNSGTPLDADIFTLKADGAYSAFNLSAVGSVSGACGIFADSIYSAQIKAGNGFFGSDTDTVKINSQIVSVNHYGTMKWDSTFFNDHQLVFDAAYYSEMMGMPSWASRQARLIDAVAMRDSSNMDYISGYIDSAYGASNSWRPCTTKIWTNVRSTSGTPTPKYPGYYKIFSNSASGTTGSMAGVLYFNSPNITDNDDNEKDYGGFSFNAKRIWLNAVGWYSSPLDQYGGIRLQTGIAGDTSYIQLGGGMGGGSSDDFIVKYKAAYFNSYLEGDSEYFWVGLNAGMVRGWYFHRDSAGQNLDTTRISGGNIFAGGKIVCDSVRGQLDTTGSAIQNYVANHAGSGATLAQVHDSAQAVRGQIKDTIAVYLSKRFSGQLPVYWAGGNGTTSDANNFYHYLNSSSGNSVYTIGQVNLPDSMFGKEVIVDSIFVNIYNASIYDSGKVVVAKLADGAATPKDSTNVGLNPGGWSKFNVLKNGTLNPEKFGSYRMRFTMYTNGSGYRFEESLYIVYHLN